MTLLLTICISFVCITNTIYAGSVIIMQTRKCCITEPKWEYLYNKPVLNSHGWIRKPEAFVIHIRRFIYYRRIGNAHQWRRVSVLIHSRFNYLKNKCSCWWQITLLSATTMRWFIPLQDYTALDLLHRFRRKVLRHHTYHQYQVLIFIRIFIDRRFARLMRITPLIYDQICTISLWAAF